MKRLRRKGDAAAAPTPKAAATGSYKPVVKFKRMKADPEKLKAAAAESADPAEASASAPAPASKPVEASPAVAAAAGNGVVAQSKTEDSKATGKESMKGREEEKGKAKGEDSNTSRTEITKARGEERVRREEKRRRTTGKEEEEEEGDDEKGFIFMCSGRTKPECYRSGVFGLPRGKMDVVEKIRPGAKLFLYDFDLKLMYGVYKADTRGGLDLVRHAFEGKFPAQVKFSVDIDCLPVPERSLKHAIKENYNAKGRFTQELSSKQVRRLLAIFKPIGLSQPAPQHIEETRLPRIVEDRQEPYDYEERQLPKHIEETRSLRIVEDRRDPYDYEERRLQQHPEEIVTSIHARADLLEDHYKMTHSLRPPLLDEPRRSLVLDPYQMQEPQHVPPKYYHQVATMSLNHQPRMDILHERTAAVATVMYPLLARDYRALPGEHARTTAAATVMDPLLARDYRALPGEHGRTTAEAIVRDPLLARDYGSLPGELAARSEHVDELYRSYKLSTRAMDLHPGPSYATTSYDNPSSLYSGSLQRPVVTRVRGPSVPVSTRYSFDGPPAYR
ncbi:hypothetical protein HU200_017401 [Digitaria exilis]|uniref:DCD domain-containing protein n=1 Tax=Digitaria exilis TaxID=1010633 RepID=A0A835F610_9POAL|nr:hypothetical protein HU200_017401 [Digitaria exilis]